MGKIYFFFLKKKNKKKKKEHGSRWKGELFGINIWEIGWILNQNSNIKDINKTSTKQRRTSMTNKEKLYYI